MAGRKTRAFALVLVLVVFSLLLGATALLMSRQVVEAQLLRREMLDLELQILADSAISLAMAQIKADPGTSGEQALELNDGEVSLEISELDTTRKSVAIVARRLGVTRRVTVVIQLTKSGPRLIDWRPVAATPSP
jgi:hypothetical protein